ncbi:NAD-dependent succinate-semialdehyde dehydrogenase [Cellvibrio sp. UBA7661]|uniref:NAD-dependent succinate-semialdehyde dehydrogenase n=1 Tax=Cellvibrio sp. UBA7661 TaxID=1946311 RepID=UPI002F3522CE
MPISELGNPLLLRTGAFIGGKWCESDSKKYFPVTNPATGELITRVADAGAEDARRAISAAAQAQSSWGQKTAQERSRLLHAWHALVLKYLDDLALILTLEQGKPLREARAEIAYGASYIEWFAEEAKRIYGDVIAPQHPDQRILVIKQPVGVVTAITPWNFPNAMLARKLAPALAAGCAVVAKPAAETPLSALALAWLAEEAGIPAGVINIVPSTDASSIGVEFSSNKLVRKLSFTGSTRVGKLLIQQCADDVKRITLELGGNAPFIVFEDADLDVAVAGAMASKFRNAGQTCVCANRFYIHRNIQNIFCAKLIQAMQSLSIGNGVENETQIGPLISQAAVNKVQTLVDDALKKGALIAYQADLEKSLAETGFYYPPTMLCNIASDSILLTQEIFGPVVAVLPFDSDEEVVELANNTDYGLAAYCFTRDTKRIKRLSEVLVTGMLGINTGVISNAMAPFGGVKHSGWGREGAHYGIADYLEIKYICEQF